MTDLPEPWLVVKDAKGFLSIHSSNENGGPDDLIASLWQDADVAQMLAAAPKMLAALEQACAHFGPFADITINGQHDPYDVRVVAQIRAAIEAAKGEA